MQPVATIKGRLVTAAGEASFDFGIVVSGAVPSDTLLANRMHGGQKSDHGRFEKTVPPDVQYSGGVLRKTHEWQTRPILGAAFGPVTPIPGEILDLGDIVVP